MAPPRPLPAPTFRPFTAATLLPLAALLTACTTVTWQPPQISIGGRPQGPTWAGGPNLPAATVAPASAASAAAFDTVVKGAERVEGVMPLWRRQDKVWIELAPGDFGRPLFLSPRLKTGLGEGGFYGGLLASRWAQVGRPQWVEFRRVNQQVQLVAVNAAFTATKGTPEARAVEAAFSPSLLASVQAASQPHPTRGSVLVELSSLLVGDVLGLGLQLQRTFRQNYALDTRNTLVTRSRSSPTGVVLEVQQHYATTTLGATGGLIPGALPDPRSLFLSVEYTLSPLPDQPLPPRPADVRIGHFVTTIADFSNDLSRTPRLRYVNRWRLDRKNPGPAPSEPVRPLVFWLDRSIPDSYRPTVRDAILEWNKAFEAIGFLNAIQVRDATDREPQDMVGNGQAVVRWMTNNLPAFGAIGPAHVDPRTGEILAAEIALESLSPRAVRATRSRIFTAGMPPAGAMADGAHGRAAAAVSSGMPTLANDVPDAAAAPTFAWQDGVLPAPSTLPAPDACLHAALSAEQLDYALSIQQGVGELPPDHAEVRAFVLAYLRETTLHEVGHVLGLRHNFKGSRWRTAEQLNDRALTEREGISASVMDYTPMNLNVPGRPAGAPFQTTLGPYDYWAIEYAYKPLEGDARAQAAALRAIADRSNQPDNEVRLAYATDEDSAIGLDPHALAFDLGRDPVAYARQRLALARDLIARQAQTTVTPDDDPAILRRRIGYALRDIDRTAEVLTRQIGGLITRRDAPASRRDALEPVSPELQRQALEMLLQEVLTPERMALPSGLLRRLAPDYFERAEGRIDATGVPTATDFSIANQIMILERDVLATLMNDGLADRLLDNIDRSRDRPGRPLTVGELHRRLREAIWQPPQATPAELEAAAAWRRNLQRDHVNRLAVMVVRGSNRADVRAEVRRQAELLARQLRQEARGTRRAKDDDVAEAHRRDALETLERALAAAVQRPGP